MPRFFVAVFLSLLLAPSVSMAAGDQPKIAHGIAMHGEPKYGPDFRHFDYVNPDAPKGGIIRLGVEGTFDSFNAFIPKGNATQGSSYEALLTASADEPFTEYGLIAESIEVPADRSWVVFTLRPQARWHDDKPITVQDVIWSLDTLKSKGEPFYRFYYGSVVRAEQVGPRRVKFTFAQKGNRELPLIIGQMPILPKHYWETRNFEATTLEPPLASGPYRIASFEAGRYLVIERVKDYWGKDLPVNRGQNNFDRIRFDYYRDDEVIRLALKSGEIDYRVENQAKAWALGYDVPAVRAGWLKKEEVRHFSPTGMQALAFNTRREIFRDPKVRQALAHAFDFEWTNRNLFFGQYVRTQSYFSNSELAATGLPGPRELEILERYRGRIPDEVFTEPYQAPSTDGSGWPRANLRKAFALLAEAGWRIDGMRLVNQSTGRPFTFQIMLGAGTGFERIVLPFIRNLGRLGIDARVRLVDQAQYVNRLRSFDYDMILSNWPESNSPGNEQREFWTTKAAESPAASNYAGIKDPVVDELVELVIMAPDRESLVARTRALDRVLLAGHYVIPNWHVRVQRLLYWDKFSRPQVTPEAGTTFSYWWFDPAKAARLQQALGTASATGANRARADDNKIPGLGTALAVVAGLTAVAVFVFRRIWHRTGRA